ncbi:MAG: NAD(+) synthase [Acutalibacteraceae bacterium]
MFDYIRVASAVPKISVGNTEFNTNEIIKKIEEAQSHNTDAIVFPELCITGYTCADLFFQNTLLDSALQSLKTIIEKSKSIDSVIIIGLPIELDGQLYNCGVVIYDGKIESITPKTYIPNYNEFYEKRWFSSALDLEIDNVFSSELGLDEEYEIPVGNNIVLNLNNQVKIGVEICEDLWAPLPPSTYLTLDGAEVIFNLSASNETIAKREYRKDLIKQQSARNICGYVYSSAGADESTTDLIFSGHSLICENGTVCAENNELIDNDYIVYGDIDLGKIRFDRKKNKCFKDCVKATETNGQRWIISSEEFSLKSDGAFAKINKLPFVPSAKKDRLERCLNIFRMQVAGLKKRLSVTGCKPVIGISGGLDSTLALLVSTEAIRQLNRPLTDVIGITMPCFGTTDRTYNNSIELMKTLGVTSVEVNIKEACDLHFKDIGHDKSILDGTYENSQARERTQVLMDYASRVGGFVIGTGDLSELALGWCTYNGDHMSMYGVNASIPKTLIRWMIDSLIDYNVFEKSTEVLKDILDTPISPELLPPDEKGHILQQTEDIVGPYALHDFYLYYFMRFGFSPDKILHLAKIAFKDDFDEETILKWLKTFIKRFFTQQFKRSCLPDGVKVGSICLSPRGDWRMPSDADVNDWLKTIDK